MKKLIIGSFLVMLLLILVSCAPAVSEDKKGPLPPTEQEKELSFESWEIGENWMYGPQAIWGDVMVGLEIERQKGQITWQCISTYDLRSRKKKRVLELPTSRIADTPSIYMAKVVWASLSRSEDEQQPRPKNNAVLNWDVFLLDIKTGDVQQLTTEEHAQVCPRIYDDTVVWLDKRHEEERHNPERYDIYAYDIKSKKERRLTSSTSAEGQDLSISGNLVVWTDNRHADPEVKIHAENAPDYNNEIYVYDLSANDEKRITSYPGNDRYPAISGNNIAWLRQLQSNYIQADIFACDFKKGKETQVSYSSYAAHPWRPSIYGDRIVWADARASKGNTSGDTVINGRQGQTDIYLYNLTTLQEIQLTTTEPGKVWLSPVIHGDFVVYEWSRMIGPVVYAINLRE
jgi:Tol biopolymer transport system component